MTREEALQEALDSLERDLCDQFDASLNARLSAAIEVLQEMLAEEKPEEQPIHPLQWSVCSKYEARAQALSEMHIAYADGGRYIAGCAKDGVWLAVFDRGPPNRQSKMENLLESEDAAKRVCQRWRDNNLLSQGVKS